MINFLKTLHLYKFFLGFVFIFAYLQSIQGRILVQQNVDFYTFTPEGAIGTFIESCVVFLIIINLFKRFQKNKELDLVSVVKVFILSLLFYLLAANVFSAVVALIFNTWDRNFNYNVLFNNNIGNLLDVCIYGSFFIAYYFYRKNKKDTKQLLLYHQAFADSKIAQLKTQLNPHFLFNNLNALDQLIEEDPAKASDFLNDFAELYRYVLEVSNKKMVAIKEELTFVQAYFRMMEYKLENSYQLQVVAPVEITGFIAPLALQLLVENAIEHNLGKVGSPVNIKIELTDQLIVSNNLAPKNSKKIGGGRALKNLSQQYQLLTAQPLEITKSETIFVVKVPLIKSKSQ